MPTVSLTTTVERFLGTRRDVLREHFSPHRMSGINEVHVNDRPDHLTTVRVLEFFKEYVEAHYHMTSDDDVVLSHSGSFVYVSGVIGNPAATVRVTTAPTPIVNVDEMAPPSSASRQRRRRQGSTDVSPSEKRGADVDDDDDVTAAASPKRPRSNGKGRAPRSNGPTHAGFGTFGRTREGDYEDKDDTLYKPPPDDDDDDNEWA